MCSNMNDVGISMHMYQTNFKRNIYYHIMYFIDIVSKRIKIKCCSCDNINKEAKGVRKCRYFWATCLYFFNGSNIITIIPNMRDKTGITYYENKISPSMITPYIGNAKEYFQSSPFLENLFSLYLIVDLSFATILYLLESKFIILFSYYSLIN